MKRIDPPETADFVRERSLFMGGLGWPALITLIITGSYMLSFRGIGVGDVLTGVAFHGAGGKALAAKLLLVLLMIIYQAMFGHRRAPVAIYFNMLAALLVLGASVIFVRGLV